MMPIPLHTLPLIVRDIGRQDYQICWQAMQAFNQQRDSYTPDEIWLLEHPPVFTQGQTGKAEHVLNPGTIPVIQTDRGGQVTYHGPGQLVAYILIDLKRAHMTIRQLVGTLEKAIIALLADYHIRAIGDTNARGVYVEQAKICAIGLRVKRYCSYHGLAFNVHQVDLNAFKRINPCGYKDLKVTQLSDCGGPSSLAVVKTDLTRHLQHCFHRAYKPILKDLPTVLSVGARIEND